MLEPEEVSAILRLNELGWGMVTPGSQKHSDGATRSGLRAQRAPA